MTYSTHSIAKATIRQMFGCLEGVLKKGAAAAKTRDIEDAVYLNARLAPDMLPLVKQVQIATELPVRALSRLAGAAPPTFADDEASFADCIARVGKAAEALKALDAKAIDADPDGTITFPVGDNEMTLPRHAYFLNFVLPNLYFHTSMTYAILRHLGVEIGKRDFLAVPN